MTLEAGVDELDLEVRHAGVAVGFNPAANLFRRADQTHFRQLFDTHESLEGALADRQGAEALAPGFGRILVDAAVDFDAEMHFFRIAAVALGHFLELAETLANVFWQQPRRQPAVAKRGGSFHGGLGPAADPQWRMRLLQWLWTNLGVFKTHKRSFVAGGMSGPNLFHRAQVIVGDFPALFAIDAEHFIFTRLDG